LWTIHTELHKTLPSDNKTNWHQPSAANALFSNPISADQWHFDYEVTEKIFSKATLNGSGELLVNSTLADVLKEAVDSLPQNMNGKALNRVSFLVSKGLPGVPGKKLASVFVNYYYLQQASALAASSEKSGSELSVRRSAFQAMIERQDYYLGADVAVQLFGRQRGITRYLYQRREIKENASLNHRQKQKLLNTLQNNRKNTITINPRAGLING